MQKPHENSNDTSSTSHVVIEEIPHHTELMITDHAHQQMLTSGETFKIDNTPIYNISNLGLTSLSESHNSKVISSEPALHLQHASNFQPVSSSYDLKHNYYIFIF